MDPAFAVTDDYGSCHTTVTIPPGTDAGTTKVIGKVFMTDVKGETSITITE